MRLPSWAANGALAVFSLVMAFGAAEVLARVFYDLPSPYAIKPGLLSHDTRGAWTLSPGLNTVMDNKIDFSNKTVTIDERGIRLTPAAQGLGENARRVFLIGDSQTFGWGLADRETWANRLQESLLGQGKPYKVENLGVPAINIDQYFARLKALYLDSVMPSDLVVVSLTWNDLHTFQGDGLVERARKAVPPALGAERAVLAARVTDPETIYNPPTWRYRLYTSTGIFIPSFDGAESFLMSCQSALALCYVLTPYLRSAYYLLRGSSGPFSKIPAKTFENNFLILKEMARLIEARGATMIVNLLPNRVFFDDGYYRAYSAGGSVFPARDFMGYVAGPYCKDFALTCINAFPALKTERKDEYSYAFDGHYNPAAAALIGKFVAREIGGR